MIRNEDYGKKYYPENYLQFYAAIRKAYPNIKMISNCDGSCVKLDHPADMYDFHIYNDARTIFSMANTFDSTSHVGPKAFVSEYAVTGDDARSGTNMGLQRESEQMLERGRKSIQKALGCKGNPLAFDITAACSGFVLGLISASCYIRDLLSRNVDWTDRGTCILFGDAAGAVLVQANQRIIDGVATRLEIPKDRVITNLANYGSTSAALIPLADEAVISGKVKQGQTIAAAGFGAGLTWGSAILWTPYPLSESSPTTHRIHLPVNAIRTAFSSINPRTKQIKEDVETQGEFVNSLRREFNNAIYAEMEDVVAFVNWLDDELSFLQEILMQKEKMMHKKK